jgi:hypothetical protein
MKARVIFDEAHSEAWTIRPELAAAMQPAHPGDSSYAGAAAVLEKRDFEPSAHVSGPLDADVLDGAAVLVIAHPSDPRWEKTTGVGSPRMSTSELDAVEGFVRSGGGLIVLGETEQEKYGNNVNDLLARFGLHLRNETVQDYEHHNGAPSWVLPELGEGGRGRSGDLLARVQRACLYRATTIDGPAGARVLARTATSATVPGAPVIVASEHGDGRVVVLGDSDLFGDDCIGELDHEALWCNLVYWVARPPARRPASERDSEPGEDRDWVDLDNGASALALLQAPDGSLRQDADRVQAARLVEAMAVAIEALAPQFSHQVAYLDAVCADLRAWDFGKPDFASSLAAFAPQRVDGLRHLVVFPMYKQNASRDVCFEALIVNVPWPAWIAALESRSYANPQFVPVELEAYTRGYESECAVIFPETVSVAQRAANGWGAICCDREASRLQRVAGAACELLALNLPPDAARLLADYELARDAYILWDLIHDRTHSHGELPFDPFMVRQRAPYWMYSLEELRCDLTAFGEAVALEREGVLFARHVQYAILLDRLLRFPVTGSRVRNYDGLGGQLLFAYLHRGGYLEWRDNRLTIDWSRVAGGVGGLRNEVEALYSAGIDRSKLAHWTAAHALVSRYVPAAGGSRWSAGGFAEVEDPRPYVDLVLDDEFPLSIFYSALRAKLVL